MLAGGPRDPEKERVTRLEQAQIDKTLENNRVGLAEPSNKLILDIVPLLDDNLTKCRTPRSASDNTRILKKVSDYAVKQAENLADSQIKKIDPLQLTTKLVDNFSSDNSFGFQFDFVLVGKKFRQYCLTAPTVSFMYGPLHADSLVNPPEKKQKQKEKVAKKKTEQEVNPTAVGSKDLTETMTKKRVETQLTRLPGKETPMPYFKFVVNPDSFTETVENMFDFSFNIKEGNAAMVLDEEKGYPIVYRMKKKPAPEEFHKTVYPGEAIIKFTYADFEEIIKAYKIRKAFIAPRSKKRRRSSAANETHDQ